MKLHSKTLAAFIASLLLFCTASAFAAFKQNSTWNSTLGGLRGFDSSDLCVKAVRSHFEDGSGGWGPRIGNDIFVIDPVTTGVKPDRVTNFGYSYSKGGAPFLPLSCHESNEGSCPANSVKVGDDCVCNTDHAERIVDGAYQCVPQIESDCSQSGMIWNSTLTTDRSGRARGPYGKFADGAIACFGTPSGPNGSGKGCKHMFTGDLGFKDADGIEWTNGFSWAFTEKDLKDPRLKGELSCDLTDNPLPDEEPAVKPNDKECKDGYRGEVNGKDVCIEAWTGETQGVDFGLTKGPDGTVTETKNNINCNGDQCTVTETNTIKDSNGNVIKTTTNTVNNVNRQTYCAKNPESAVCGRKEDQSGGTKGQGGKGGGGGGGGDSGELDDKYTEIGAPKLYEKKYEDGVKGVWDKHAEGLKNSSLGGLAGKLFPNYGDGGAAPSYIIDLNLGGKLNLGSYDLNFDPRVWLALKAFTIICALALARRLVFGG